MSFNEYEEYNKYVDIAEYLIDKCSVYIPCRSRASQNSENQNVLSEHTRMLKVFYSFKEYMFKNITDIDLEVLGVSRKNFESCTKKASLSRVQLRYLFTTKRFMEYVYHSESRLKTRYKKGYPTIKIPVNLENYFGFCGHLATCRHEFLKNVNAKKIQQHIGQKNKLKYKIRKKTESTIDSLNDVIDIISEYWTGSNIYDSFKDGDTYTSLKDLAVKFNNIALNIGDKEWDYVSDQLDALKNGKQYLLTIYSYPINDNDKFYQYLLKKEPNDLYPDSP